MNSESVESVLFIHPGGLGDVLLAYQALESVTRYFKPKEVFLAANPAPRHALKGQYSPVPLEAADFASLFVEGPRFKDNFRDFLASMDLIISWMGSGSENFTRNLESVARGKVVFSAFAGRDLSGCHASQVYLEALDRLSIPKPQELFTLTPGTIALDAGEKLLGRLGVSREGLILVHPGSGGEGKCWPMENFVRLAKWLERDTSSQALFVLGPAEVERGFGPRIPPDFRVAFQPSMDELIGLMALSSFYIGNDSGVTHLAGLLDCRGLAVFVKTDPDVWAPAVGAINIQSEGSFGKRSG